MIDCIYCINRLRMLLFLFFVEDGNGNEIVGYVFIIYEIE